MAAINMPGDIAPAPIRPTASPGAPSPASSASSSSSSLSSEPETATMSRRHRPKLGPRLQSASIIVPKDKPIEVSTHYPPTDARAMSPRRESADVQRLGQDVRQTLKDQAKTLHSSLQVLADRIDQVRSDHDKLEHENKVLQDYIGGLTRKMSKSDIQSTSGAKAKKSASFKA